MSAPAAPGPYPLLLEGWRDFARSFWRCRVEVAEYGLPGKALPRLRAVLLLNRRGQVFQPDLCPELALTFEAGKPGAWGATQDWLRLGALLAADLARRGIQGGVNLPADVADARPFGWAGLRVGVQYTAILPFPYLPLQAGGGIRRAIARAQAAGYTVTPQAAPAGILPCLLESARRSRFPLKLDRAALELALGALGPDALRLYACHGPGGQAAAVRGVLFSPGRRAVDWLSGTADNALGSGATQLLVDHVLRDVQAAGASGFDFEGADLPGVAESKLRWGARLAPLVALRQPSLRNLARDAWRLIRPVPPPR